MNIEELAFKDRKILANLNAVDLLNIIEFLQDDRRQCLEELSKTHNRSVEIQKENKELKLELSGYRQAILKDKEMLGLKEENDKLKKQLELGEEHNKLKEEITNLSKDVDMWNTKYNDMFDENRMLKKQVAGKIEISENQQKEFINYINSYIKLLKDKPDLIEEGQKDILEEILQKYRSIIGGDALSELIITQ